MDSRDKYEIEQMIKDAINAERLRIGKLIEKYLPDSKELAEAVKYGRHS